MLKARARVKGAFWILVFLVCAFPVHAQTVVQGFNAARDSGPNGTLGFITSPYYAVARNVLSSAFGSGFVFGTSSSPAGVSAVTPEVLLTSDIFVITGMTVTLSQEEVCLLETFVEHGGAVVSFRNEFSPPLLFGVQAGSFGGSGFATVLDPASSLIVGPFGTVTSPVNVGADSEYVVTGGGDPLLADAGRTMTLVFGPDTGQEGRAVLIGDEEIFLNGPVPFPAAPYGTVPNNQTLLKNTFSYLAGAPGFDLAGAPDIVACGCDPASAWKNHGQYVRCVVQECKEVTDLGALTKKQCAQIVSQAVQSNVRKR